MPDSHGAQGKAMQASSTGLCCKRFNFSKVYIDRRSANTWRHALVLQSDKHGRAFVLHAWTTQPRQHEIPSTLLTTQSIPSRAHSLTTHVSYITYHPIVTSSIHIVTSHRPHHHFTSQLHITTSLNTTEEAYLPGTICGIFFSVTTVNKHDASPDMVLNHEDRQS